MCVHSSRSDSNKGLLAVYVLSFYLMFGILVLYLLGHDVMLCRGCWDPNIN